MRRILMLCLVLVGPVAAQDSLAVVNARLRLENDSLRARLRTLNAAVRDLILASSDYATQARNAEALLSWYRNRPDRCVVLPDST